MNFNEPNFLANAGSLFNFLLHDVFYCILGNKHETNLGKDACVDKYVFTVH